VQIHAIARQQVEQIVGEAGGHVLRTEVAPDFQHKTSRYQPLFYWIRHPHDVTSGVIHAA
jgi:hypothetical protein